MGERVQLHIGFDTRVSPIGINSALADPSDSRTPAEGAWLAVYGSPLLL